MAPVSLSEAVDTLYTTTWYLRKDNLVDQIFDGTPFWFWLKSNNGIESVEGGDRLAVNLRYGKSDRVKFIGKGGTVDLAENEFATMGFEDWKFMVDSIVRFGVDEAKNRGRSQIINLMNAKLDVSRETLTDKLESTLFGSVSADALGFNGLQDLIADDPTTGTLHQVSAVNNTWWRNQATNMTGLSFATYGVQKMRTMLNNCNKNLGGTSVRIIISGQTPYEYYEDSVTEQKRIVNQKMADAGFESIQYKGVPMTWAPACSSGRMYFLNTDHLKFKYHPSLYFDMTEWKAIPNQVNDRAAQIMLGGNLVTDRRRVHGVLYNIDTE